MEHKTAYLSLGANIGNKIDNLNAAVQMLDASEACSVSAKSSLYKTKPVGYDEQPDFINAVIEVKTLLSPNDLLKLCNDIERNLGRERTIHWGPRVIDIDILLYGNEIINEENLLIPHPRMMERAFVLVPLSEIAPGLILPDGIKAIDAVSEIDTGGVVRIEEDSWSS